MARIAIAGASGAIGQLTLQAAEEAGHEVIALDRRHGVDLLSREGLDAALAGAEAVIDTSQVCSPLAEDPTTPILQAARNLAEAAEQAGLQRLVLLSINGVEKENLQEFPFYAARFQQEQAVAEAPVPHTVVRSAQWFEFALNPAGTTQQEDVVQAQDWAIQPLPAAEVARFLVEAAEGQHGEGVVTVAGPERMRLPQLTEKTLRAQGDARPVEVVEAPLPALADGSLYAPQDAVLLGPPLEQWLQQS